MVTFRGERGSYNSDAIVILIEQTPFSIVLNKRRETCDTPIILPVRLVH